jgi:hypothetical protein
LPIIGDKVVPSRKRRLLNCAVYDFKINSDGQQLKNLAREQRGSIDVVILALGWALFTFLLIFIFSLALLSITGNKSQPGKEALAAAKLTVNAQQPGQQLGSEAALSAAEPELNEYFITNGKLDQYQIIEDGRSLNIEYQSAGGVIRLVFSDGRLLTVSCNDKIKDCPTAAEL